MVEVSSNIDAAVANAVYAWNTNSSSELDLHVTYLATLDSSPIPQLGHLVGVAIGNIGPLGTVPTEDIFTATAVPDGVAVPKFEVVQWLLDPTMEGPSEIDLVQGIVAIVMILAALATMSDSA